MGTRNDISAEEKMSTDGGEGPAAGTGPEGTPAIDADMSYLGEELQSLISNGIDERIAEKLGHLFDSKKLAFNDLDERAFEALKEFGSVDGALAVLAEFDESNLEHVSNKSAFLCGIMKTHHQKGKAAAAENHSPSSSSSSPSKQDPNHTYPSNHSQTPHPGPDEGKLKAILDRTGYTLDVTSGQRKYGGPPPGWEGSPPGPGSEVFVGKIPKEIFEDEIIPMFEECGTIWDLRLMVDPLTGFNRGYCFITYCVKDDAQTAQEKYDGYEIRKGKNLKVNISVPNLRLFVGNIPKSKSREEIYAEFLKLTAGLLEVIVYSSPDDRKRNRGFCFLEYDSHKSASLAKRKLSSGRTKVWGCDILVDWADPQEEPDQETMSKVKVLYVRNLVGNVSEEQLREEFEKYGSVERVKKIKDYAFVHFDDRENAISAMSELNGKEFHGINIEVSLAKPPSDRKKKEEVLRNRERRVMLMMQQRALMLGVPGMPRGPSMMPPVPNVPPPPPPVPMMPPRGGGSGGGRSTRPGTVPPMTSPPAYGHRGGQMPRGGYEYEYGCGYGQDESGFDADYPDYPPPPPPPPPSHQYEFGYNEDGYGYPPYPPPPPTHGGPPSGKAARAKTMGRGGMPGTTTSTPGRGGGAGMGTCHRGRGPPPGARAMVGQQHYRGGHHSAGGLHPPSMGTGSMGDPGVGGHFGNQMAHPGGHSGPPVPPLSQGPCPARNGGRGGTSNKRRGKAQGRGIPKRRYNMT